LGWAGKKNGELLALMFGAGLEVLFTVDQNLRHQQNLTASGVSVVVMVAPLIPKVDAALSGIQPGDVVEIQAE